MTNRNNIGEYIRSRYEALGFASLAELADSIGVSRRTLYNWIENSTEIKISNLMKLAGVIQVHPVSLLRIVTQGFVFTYPVHSHPLTRFDDSGFIDETIPDDSNIGSGTTFEKIWWIQNTGSSVWKGRKLVCQDDHKQLYEKQGDEYIPFHSCVLTADAPEISISTIKPQETAELRVQFTAPLLPGRAVSIWKMTEENGEICYPNKPGYWCQVKVTGFY